MAEAADKGNTWSTQVQIVLGPPDYHVCTPGETIHFKIAVLPQNNCPGAITQTFFYIGQPGKPKTVFKLYEGVPGRNPGARMQDIKYKVPTYKHVSKRHAMLLEFGWNQEMQYTWADAMECFKKKGFKGNWLYTMPVQPAREPKESFLIDLCAPLPTHAIAGEAISLDISYRAQNHYPGAISQALIYFKDGEGDCDITQLDNSVPGTNPSMRRGGLTYVIPKSAVGQELEVGAFFDLQYKFDHAVENFKKKNNPDVVFGKIKVIASDSKDAPKTRAENYQLKPTHAKLQKEINHLFHETKNGASKATKWVKEKYEEEGGNKRVVQEGVKYAVRTGAFEAVKFGARRAVASEVTKATLVQAMQQGGRRAAIVGVQGGTKGMQAAGGFALGIQAVKGANAAGLAAIPGELIGGIVGKEIGKQIDGKKGGDVGKEIGALGGAMAAGAAMGSVVPGAGTAAGAAAGAVSYGIGKGVEALGGAFGWW